MTQPMDADRSGRLLREILLASFMSSMPSADTGWASATLARFVSEVSLAAGEVLYVQGSPTNELYFIVEGEVRLEAPGVPPWTRGERQLVGTIDVQLERPRSRTATATRRTRLLRIPAGDWTDLLEDSAELTRAGIENLARGVHLARLEVDALGLDETPASSVRMRAGSGDARDLGLVERIVGLRGIPLFATADWQSLARLGEVATVVDLDAGEVLVGPAVPNDALYVVVAGCVTASRPAADRRVTFGAGTLVLGCVAISPEDLGYTVQADVPTRALRLVREDCFDIMEDHFSLARSAMRALAAEREETMNERARRDTAPP